MDNTNYVQSIKVRLSTRPTRRTETPPGWDTIAFRQCEKKVHNCSGTWVGIVEFKNRTLTSVTEVKVILHKSAKLAGIHQESFSWEYFR